jgi:hypothetical protein
MAEADTSYTEADIIALKRAMKLNLREVTTADGKRIVRGTLKEDLALLAAMERDVYGSSRSRRVQLISIRSDGS